MTNPARERSNEGELAGHTAGLSTESFWKEPSGIVRRDVDLRFRFAVQRLFATNIRELDRRPLRTYDALDLLAYVDAHPEFGEGNWLTVTNARGEQVVLSRTEVRQKKPVIVVGIDDERNLFRLFVTYNMYRTYSWKPESEPLPLFIRQLGAFLFVPHEKDDPTGTLGIATMAAFALTGQSFRVVKNDPLAVARTMPAIVSRLLTNEQGCLQCHSLRGEGARSHHLRADTGEYVGAEALAFEDYPRDVLRRFLFAQDDVAREFGVSPIRVDPVVASAFLNLVPSKE